MATLAGLKISSTVTLTPAPTAVTGIGVPILLIDVDSGSILSAPGSQKLYTGSPDAIIAAINTDETAGAMSATDALRARTVMSQYRAPSRLLIAAYDSTDSETVADALDRVVAAGNAYTGVVSCSNPTVGNIAAVATWRAVGTRRQRYLQIDQSDDASLVTSSPTSSLAAVAAIPGCRLIAHSSSTVPVAAADLGLVTAYPLDTAPIGTDYRIGGLALATYDDGETQQAVDNACSVYVDLSESSPPAQRLTTGALCYDTTEWSAWVTLVYSLAVARAAVIDLLGQDSARQTKLDRSTTGRGRIAGAVSAALAPLAAAGHYEPGPVGTGPDQRDAPAGYLVTPSVSGTSIACRVQLRIAGVAQSIALNFEGEVVS